jgi:hypothetical protein
MSPGRELDAEIARKVFGCEVVHQRTSVGRLDYLYKVGSGLVVVPPYSTHVASAWLVIEHFKNQGDYKLEISAYPKDEVWTIKAYHKEGYAKSCTTSAKTIQLAICLAALKA